MQFSEAINSIVRERYATIRRINFSFKEGWQQGFFENYYASNKYWCDLTYHCWRLLTRSLPKAHALILEIGAGVSNSTTEKVAQFGLTVYGLDIDKRVLN